MARAPATATVRPTTIDWSETVAMAAGRMRAAAVGSLDVLDESGRLGRITLADIERCSRQGNWLDAVLVRDLLQLPGPPPLDARADPGPAPAPAPG